jgi:hypothetical protein
VRGTLEKEFARYLDDRSKERKKEGILATGVALATAALRPSAIRVGKNVADRMLNPDGPAFEEQLERLRSRKRGGDQGSGDEGGSRSGTGL